MFTSSLTLFNHSSYNNIYPLSDLMLDRFCFQILPSIHHKIKWIDVKVSSMKRILSANYPILSGLGIYNIEKDTDLDIFTDETSLMYILKNQISSLMIESSRKQGRPRDVNTRIFTNILNTFINLQYFMFHSWFSSFQRISFRHLRPTVFSSTLLELRVKVSSVDDCLFLLDGRFNQLRAFYVDIASSLPKSNFKINKEKLPNLRCFSLYCFSEIRFYDNIIIPLLHRMSNLEELALYLSSVVCDKKFIDGNNLKQNIIDYMPELNQFRFSIHSTILLKDQIDLPSNEDIKHSFKDFSNNKIISCVNYFFEAKYGQCHIYSCPYPIPTYENISNNFPSGLFRYVSDVSLFDEYPFEYEFFIQIAQSFPLLKNLTITNQKGQNNKQYRKSNNNNEDFLLIRYPHLKYLHFKQTHNDYIEQFLLDTKTCLPYDILLFTDFKSLQRVTHNFTRNATRINCSKMRYICFDRISRFPKHFKNYFLDTEIHVL
ncbi:unnamed protein product [Rotaria sordida]|uniref:Uncharacterized protein n=1 Tax=Rotaria sordida TaxID=392033 RepID=A0A815H8G2_9BILA|nr:unnamed protein product [Rotaria sordida]